MSGNSPSQPILEAPGAAPAPTDREVMCKAYAEGLKNWCAKGGKKAYKDFNSAVFENVDRQHLHDARENPIGILTTPAGGTQQAVGLQALADGGNAHADSLINTFETRTFASSGRSSPASYRLGSCSTTRSQLRQSGVQVDRVLCPDSMTSSGNPIEIKRPTEGESHDGQVDNYSKAAGGKPTEVISLTACKLAPKPWTQDCPDPFPALPQT